MLKEGQRPAKMVKNKELFALFRFVHSELHHPMGKGGIREQRNIDSPFLGRGILGSGRQRQTCPAQSGESAEIALGGGPSSVGLTVSSMLSPLTTASSDASLFLLDLGDVTAGDGGSSLLVRSTGLDVGAARVS